jgi:hypothetical protein
MGELSRPIMTPLGVVYRNLCYAQVEALNHGEWAVKLFGGSTAAFHQIGPNMKGFYEPGVLATVPAGVRCVKKSKEPADTGWYSVPEVACVLVDDTSTPIALYFEKRGLLLKPKESPPLTAYCVVAAS